jgi:pyroglutamyl-peptidase
MRTDDLTHVLLTGFGPFLNRLDNPSSRLVPAVAAAARRLPGVRITSELLATEWTGAPARVDALLAELRPDIVLHFGISSRAKGFVIEQRARNYRQPLDDATGCKPPDARIVADGPEYLPATVPVAAVVSKLRGLDLPVVRSRNAGKYVCNALLYSGLWSLETKPGIRLGFIHLPLKLPDGAPKTAPNARPVLTFDQAVAGGVAIVEACRDARRKA